MTQQEPAPDDVLTDDTEASVGPTGGEQGLSLDDRFEILKNERRRLVLEGLSSIDGPTTLGTLADRIAAVENNTTVEDVTSSERKRVYVALYQFHLPKMDRMGVVEYDKDRGDVALTADGRSLYQEHEAEQSDDYLDALDIGACTLGAVVLAGVVLTEAWLVGTVFLGVLTALLAVKIVVRRLL